MTTVDTAWRRTLDLLVGTALALLATPIILLLAIGNVVALRANPFFMQERIGARNRVFHLLKLRTLPPAAPAYADKYAIASVQIPQFCRLLRRLHLDELPQLWLIPLGAMSLVGPRPEMAFLHQQMHPAHAEHRTRIRPGVTGLWQISVDCEQLIHETPRFDLFYLYHHSIRLDAWILWRTALKMLAIGEPISIDDIPEFARAREDRQFDDVMDDISVRS